MKEIRYFGNNLDEMMRGANFAANLKARGIEYDISFDVFSNQFAITWEEPFLNLENK